MSIKTFSKNFERTTWWPWRMMVVEEEAKAEAKEEREVLTQDLRDERGRSGVREKERV